MSIIKRLKKHIINNDKEFILYKRFYKIINELIKFEYTDMLLSDDSNDIPDFSKSSMYCYNDPIEYLVRLTNNIGCKPLNDNDKYLLSCVNSLIVQNNEGIHTSKISYFSGLTFARSDKDWGTLENYGKNLTYYLDTDEYYNQLMKIFNNPSPIKGAIYHSWTNRYYFYNVDGSHRLAALLRQDTTKNRNTEVKLELQKRVLCKNNCEKIIENFIGIITTGKTYTSFANIFKLLNINILLEKYNVYEDNIYILWLKKSDDMFMDYVLKFIKLLPLNKCYVITDALEKYI